MTFNLLVLVAVIIGIGIGFCIFGPIRHNRELKLFKYFETVDSCQERLLPSHDQSKAGGDYCAINPPLVVADC